MAPPDDVPERLKAALADRYRIEREIGSGGMATVYLAEDLKHHRKVAVKVLDPDLAATIGADRFLREIETAANLLHPHILPVHDSGEADGFLFYVMPYVRGGSLRDRLEEEKQLPVEDALQIAREIADALAHAHERDVIHRDVKPANILLAGEHALLADFGVAQAIAEADEGRLTRTGVSLGTPAYMSPEQASGEQDLDGRSDQYALGCVLYEMLAGQPPFTGAPVESVVRQHLTAEPPAVTQTRPSVAREVEEVITRSLAKNPADRFRTTGKMASALAGTPRFLATGGRRGRTKALVYAGTVILGLVTAAVFASRWSPGGSDFPEDVVVVIPFSNETGDPAFDPEAKMAALFLAERLDASAVARVVPHSEAILSWEAALARRATEPGHNPRTAVAAQMGAGTVVDGSIFLQADSLLFNAEITGEGGTERIQSVDPVVVAVDSVRRGIETVSERVAAALAFHLDPGTTDWARYVSPMPSLAVYRDYAGSYEAFFRGDLEESRRLVERALLQDSTYVPAKVGLAIIHLNLGNRIEADSLLNATERSKDRMGPGHRIQWDWIRAMLDGDREGAYLATKEGVERTPSPIMVGSLAFEALRMNRPREALDVLSDLDPDTPGFQRWPRYWSDLAEALHTLGNHDRELSEAERGRGRHPNHYPILRAEIRAHAALGNAQEVWDLVEEAVLRDLEPTRALRDAALELRAHENPEASRSIGERALAYLGSRPGEISITRTHRFELLRALYLLERWDEAQAIAEELAREEPSNLDYLGYLGTLAARKGEEDEALRINQELAGLDRPFLRGNHTRWRARIAALLGNKEQAVSLLRQAHEEGIYLSISIHTDMDLEPLRGYSAFEEFIRPRG